MAIAKRPSPCCNAPSELRRIRAAEKQIDFACSECGQRWVHTVGSTPPPRRNHLKLIVSR